MLKPLTRLLAVGFALAAVFAGSSSPVPLAPALSAAAVGDCSAGSNWGTARQDLTAQVITLVNQHRTALGLTALKSSPTLTGSALWKARHMAFYNYFDHPDPAPPVARSVGDRLSACGYPTATTGWGENIAYGYATPDAVMSAWLNSPGHRANIENASFRVIGVGAASSSAGRLYWVQDFGTFDDSGAPPPPSPPVPPPPPPPPVPPPPPPPAGSVTAAPYGAWIVAGSLRSGSSSRLAALDSSYLQVNSSQGQTSWYARFNAIPNTLKSLSITYNGSNAAACTQSVSVWNWTTNAWVALDSRQVGPTAVTVTAAPPGTLANYVANVSGNGDVAVKVSCARSDLAPFYSSGDLLRIQYTR